MQNVKSNHDFWNSHILGISGMWSTYLFTLFDLIPKDPILTGNVFSWYVAFLTNFIISDKNIKNINIIAAWRYSFKLCSKATETAFRI